MNEVSRDFANNYIQRSPASLIGRLYASCVRSSLIYVSETRPFLADGWLKFEGVEMKMIRWKRVVSMKDLSLSQLSFEVVD